MMILLTRWISPTSVADKSERDGISTSRLGSQPRIESGSMQAAGRLDFRRLPGFRDAARRGTVNCKKELAHC